VRSELQGQEGEIPGAKRDCPAAALIFILEIQLWSESGTRR
jgi:hypothetical protein